MKKIKNKVLTLLLLTFAFFVVHDCVVDDLHYVASYELSYNVVDKAYIEKNVHESVHNIFFNFQEASSSEEKLLDIAPSSIQYSLSSNINPVSKRPPLS